MSIQESVELLDIEVENLKLNLKRLKNLRRITELQVSCLKEQQKLKSLKFDMPEWKGYTDLPKHLEEIAHIRQSIRKTLREEL